jgi:hypothetical protein
MVFITVHSFSCRSEGCGRFMVRGVDGAQITYQDERSEREQAATGKADRDARVRLARCLEGVSTKRTTERRDGDVDSTDNTAWSATQGGGGVYNRHLDADLDGDNDSFDKTAFDRNYLAAGDSVEVSGRAWSPSGMDYGYTGRRLDPPNGAEGPTWVMGTTGVLWVRTLAAFIARVC